MSEPEGEDEDQDFDVRVQVGELLREFRIADDARRLELLRNLTDLTWTVGPSASLAIPLLIDWLPEAEPQAEDSICYALKNMAPFSIPPLLALLQHPSAVARERGAAALGLLGQDIGDHRTPVANALLEKFDDPSLAVRRRAIFAVGLLQDARETTIERLIAVCRGEIAVVRAAAFHAIGNIGSSLADNTRLGISVAGPVVLEGLDDPDESVRCSACHAFEYLDFPSDTHIERLLHILEHDTSIDVRRRASSQLKSLVGRNDASDLALRLAGLVGQDRQISSSIFQALRKIGPRARTALPILLLALNSEDDFVVLEAAEAVWAIDKRAELVIPHLDRLFEDHGEKVCDILCALGHAGEPLLPKLIKALEQDDYWDLQWAAADAIGLVASGSAPSLSALKGAIGHESGIVRSAAARAFARIGGPATSVLTDILVQETDPKKLEWVADALSQMGPEALPAVSELRTRLQSPQRGVRYWSALALASIAQDVDAVPALIELLEDSERSDLWPKACEGLAKIGPAARNSRDILEDLGKSPIEELRVAAQSAISAIDVLH